MANQVRVKDIPVIESAKNGYWEIYDDGKRIWHKTKYLPKGKSKFIQEEVVEFPNQNEVNVINQEIDDSFHKTNMQIKNPSEYVTAKIDVQDGDYITIKDEGEYRPLPQDSAREVLSFKVQIPSSIIKRMSINATSQRELILAWGSNSAAWVNKRCLVTIVKQQVFDQMKDVIYLHPEIQGPVATPPEEIIKEEEEEVVEKPKSPKKK